MSIKLSPFCNGQMNEDDMESRNFYEICVGISSRN